MSSDEWAILISTIAMIITTAGNVIIWQIDRQDRKNQTGR
jgi:hypothetical protein